MVSILCWGLLGSNSSLLKQTWEGGTPKVWQYQPESGLAPTKTSNSTQLRLFNKSLRKIRMPCAKSELQLGKETASPTFWSLLFLPEGNPCISALFQDFLRAPLWVRKNHSHLEYPRTTVNITDKHRAHRWCLFYCHFWHGMVRLPHWPQLGGNRRLVGTKHSGSMVVGEIPIIITPTKHLTHHALLSRQTDVLTNICNNNWSFRFAAEQEHEAKLSKKVFGHIRTSQIWKCQNARTKALSDLMR